MRAKRLFKKTIRFLKKNGATGLAVMGIGGVVTTAYFVAKETPKAKERLDSLENPTLAEKVGAVVSSYPKSIISGVATIGCIAGSHYLSEKEIAALTAFAATQVTKTKKLEKYIGKDKADEIEELMVSNQLDYGTVVENTAIRTGKGDVLCYEPYYGHYFYSSQQSIESDTFKLNKECDNNKYDSLSMNDFYKALGLPENDAGERFGFPYDPNDTETIDIYFGGGKTPEGIPYLIIKYVKDPRRI